jgi:hypothetical protein
MDQQSALRLWNELANEMVSDDTENATKIGAVAISHGLSTWLYASDNEQRNKDRAAAAAFLHKWADGIEGRINDQTSY